MEEIIFRAGIDDEITIIANKGLLYYQKPACEKPEDLQYMFDPVAHKDTPENRTRLIAEATALAISKHFL